MGNMTTVLHIVECRQNCGKTQQVSCFFVRWYKVCYTLQDITVLAYPKQKRLAATVLIFLGALVKRMWAFPFHFPVLEAHMLALSSSLTAPKSLSRTFQGVVPRLYLIWAFQTEFSSCPVFCDSICNYKSTDKVKSLSESWSPRTQWLHWVMPPRSNEYHDVILPQTHRADRLPSGRHPCCQVLLYAFLCF